MREVCGLDYPIAVAREGRRRVPSSLYTFPLRGLARDCHQPNCEGSPTLTPVHQAVSDPGSLRESAALPTELIAPLHELCAPPKRARHITKRAGFVDSPFRPDRRSLSGSFTGKITPRQRRPAVAAIAGRASRDDRARARRQSFFAERETQASGAPQLIMMFLLGDDQRQQKTTSIGFVGTCAAACAEVSEMCGRRVYRRHRPLRPGATEQAGTTAPELGVTKTLMH